MARIGGDYLQQRRTAPERKTARINARPDYLRPVVEGGGPDVLIVVSLVAQRA